MREDDIKRIVTCCFISTVSHNEIPVVKKIDKLKLLCVFYNLIRYW